MVGGDASQARQRGTVSESGLSLGEIIQGGGLFAYASASIYWLRMLTQAYLDQAQRVAVIEARQVAVLGEASGGETSEKKFPQLRKSSRIF